MGEKRVQGSGFRRPRGRKSRSEVRGYKIGCNSVCPIRFSPSTINDRRSTPPVCERGDERSGMVFHTVEDPSNVGLQCGRFWADSSMLWKTFPTFFHAMEDPAHAGPRCGKVGWQQIIGARPKTIPIAWWRVTAEPRGGRMPPGVPDRRPCGAIHIFRKRP